MLRPEVCTLALVAGLLSCADGGEDDPVCAIHDRPATADAAQGLRVAGATDAYFYADSEDGVQAGYERLNGILALAPGAYHARLNGSRHAVRVEGDRITLCTAGEVTVSGNTDAYYYLLDTLGTQLAYERVGRPLSVFPGAYVARVNGTRAAVAVRAGETARLAAGAVRVTGTTDEYFYVLDPAGAQLAYARLGELLDLLPGDYAVRVNASRAPARIRVDEITSVSTGTIVLVAETDEYYYVLDTLGVQLGYARFGQPSAYVPGTYRLRVTSTDTTVTVTADSAREVRAGAVVVTGAGDDYYYVLDPGGRQLGYARRGQALTLLAGTYTVRIGDTRRSVTVTAGDVTTIGT